MTAVEAAAAAGMVTMSATRCRTLGWGSAGKALAEGDKTAVLHAHNPCEALGVMQLLSNSRATPCDAKTTCGAMGDTVPFVCFLLPLVCIFLPDAINLPLCFFFIFA